MELDRLQKIHYHGLPEDAKVPGSTYNDNESAEAVTMEKLLVADWRDLWDQPLTAEELLTIGGKEFEALFHEPPIGPIPNHLAPYLSVYGCVAEYEDKLEELDRWKALELTRWLKAGVGKSWCVAGRTYELHLEKEEDAGNERFRLTLAKDHPSRE
ncbi:MAG TPA: hypothetical protein DCE18_06215 [Syntrophobacteraceae bacterium]|jgi:hypothetical protein|nr:hypothetical protein [Syntrophobacteraceae bacterium]